MKEKQFDKIDKIKIYAEFPNQKEKEKEKEKEKKDPKPSLLAMFEGQAGSDLDDDA